ncbi:DUF6268 family outer membrane beta-barrel protein [Cytophagaceae bacterium ABcell3]|nr:DUF6268 family outer membrane beta-barrel protein [Cytophagaceae bacterium ABcell3]
MKLNVFLLLSFLTVSFQLQAQDEPWEDDDDEDYSIYEDFGVEEGRETRRFAHPKIFGLAPAKLVSVGYDVMGSNTLNSDSLYPYPGESTRIRAAHGLRLFANIPVISHNRLLVNVGGSYIRTNYVMENDINHPFPNLLQEKGLTSMGLNTTIFKPVSEKNFVMGFVAGDLNGDYTLTNPQHPRHTRLTWVAMYGRRVHDRLQYAFGATQSYRAGEVNYFPVIMYNYTSADRKWGIEALLPARAHFRRTFNTRNILMLGFELEGQSYRLNDRDNLFPRVGETHAAHMAHYDPNNLELRRSEIRVRAIYERGLTDFIWISGQFGYVINYNYNVDSGDFFRGFFGNQPYVMQNRLSNPLYFNISLNLVSP